MGKAYDYGAESQHGVPYSTGYVVDGKYNSIHSGVLGGNQKRENDFSRGATIFMALEEYVVLFLLEHFRTQKR